MLDRALVLFLLVLFDVPCLAPWGQVNDIRGKAIWTCLVILFGF